VLIIFVEKPFVSFYVNVSIKWSGPCRQPVMIPLDTFNKMIPTASPDDSIVLGVLYMLSDCQSYSGPAFHSSAKIHGGLRALLSKLKYFEMVSSIELQ
jgi:hypothetical protein